MVFDETKRNETIGNRRNETKRNENETKQSLTLEKSGNCSSAAPNTLDTIAVLFRYIKRGKYSAPKQFFFFLFHKMLKGAQLVID